MTDYPRRHLANYKGRNQLFRITAPHFMARGELKNFRVMGSRTDSYLKFMHNWSWKEVVAYCRHKNWQLQKVEEAVHTPED